MTFLQLVTGVCGGILATALLLAGVTYVLRYLADQV